MTGWKVGGIRWGENKKKGERREKNKSDIMVDCIK